MSIESLDCRQRHLVHVLFDERSQRHLRELVAVGPARRQHNSNGGEDLPKVHAHAVDVCRREEVGGRGEGQTRGDAGGAERVDELARWDVKSADHRVLRGRHHPARIGGEGLRARSAPEYDTSSTHEVENRAPETAQLSHDPSRLNVDDADDEVVAGDREQPVVALQENRSYRGRDRHRLDVLHRLEVKELRRSARPRRRAWTHVHTAL